MMKETGHKRLAGDTACAAKTPARVSIVSDAAKRLLAPDKRHRLANLFVICAHHAAT